MPVEQCLPEIKLSIRNSNGYPQPRLMLLNFSYTCKCSNTLLDLERWYKIWSGSVASQALCAETAYVAIVAHWSIKSNHSYYHTFLNLTCRLQQMASIYRIVFYRQGLYSAASLNKISSDHELISNVYTFGISNLLKACFTIEAYNWLSLSHFAL